MEGGGGGEKRKRFSKSWGLRASVSFAPFPLPLILFFFLLSAQLCRRTRAETLAMQAKRGRKGKCKMPTRLPSACLKWPFS